MLIGKVGMVHHHRSINKPDCHFGPTASAVYQWCESDQIQRSHKREWREFNANRIALGNGKRQSVYLLNDSQIRFGRISLGAKYVPWCTEQKRPPPWLELPEQLALRLSCAYPLQGTICIPPVWPQIALEACSMLGGSVTARQISLNGTLSANIFRTIELNCAS